MKTLVNIALCLVTLFVFSGCSKGETSPKDVKTVKKILQSVVQNSDDKNLDGTAYFDDEIFRENCQKLYGIEYSELADGGIVFSSDGCLADEISVIKLSADQNRAVNILEKRVEKRVRDFTGYKPTEITKIENAQTFVVNGFAVLIISDNAKILKRIIKNEIS